MEVSRKENKLLQQSKRSIFNILFSRSMLILLLLLINFSLLFIFLMGIFEGLPVLMGSMLVFTAVMMVFVLNSRDNPAMKLSWCAIIGVLPVFGAALYWYTRTDLGHRVSKRMVNAAIEDSLPHLPPEEAEPDGMAHYLRTQAHAALYRNSEVSYFPLGDAMFTRMLEELEKAEKFIFLEFFIIDQGQMWGKILEILHKKAKEGVEVRVMYDGTCAITTLPADYPKQLEQLGIRCKAFNPVRPFVSTHYNYRDHRKILVIDGHTAFTGGVNLADEYINVRLKYGHWKDTGILVQGPAAQGFTLLFLQLWNQTERERIYAPYLTMPAERNADGFVIPYGCGPNSPERVGEMVYVNLLNQATQYVHIMTPYLILDNEIVTALRFAAQRGVDVRIVLPHIPDKKIPFALARSHYRELMEAGVKIFEYTPGFVHAKVFLCDGVHAVVGTANLDYRSLYHHFECGAYLYKVPALSCIAADFRDTFEKSQRITMEDVKRQSRISRLTAALLKIAAPLM